MFTYITCESSVSNTDGCMYNNITFIELYIITCQLVYGLWPENMVLELLLLLLLYWNVPCGDTSSKTLIDVCVCVRRHIAKLRQE